MFWKRHSLITAAVCAWACAAPVTEPDPEILSKAERLCLDGSFVEAEPLLREYLRRDPEDAVAHYYLGRCYLSSELINLEIARGEIAAALELFHERGQKSPRGRFTDEYFELMCLTDIGKTYLSEIALTIPFMNVSFDERMREAADRINRCEALCDRAEEVNPDAHLTKWLRMRTAEITHSVNRKQR